MRALQRLARTSFFKLGTKAGLTLLAFWFVFQGIDFSHLGEILEQQNRMMLFESAMLMAVQSVLGGVRWRLITNALASAKEHCISLYQSQRIYYIGVFFTTCLPGTVGGDVVRVWMARDSGIPLPQSINSVIIDRMVALLGIGIMVLATLPVIAGVIGVDAGVVYPLAAALTVVGLVMVYYMERLLEPFSRFRVVHWGLYFIRSLKLIILHPGTCMASICLAVIAHISYSLSAYVMAHSLGIPITVMQCMAFIPLIMLVTTIPVSIGGWGLREASMVGLLGLVGIGQEAALMLSIQLGLLFMFISLPASVMWLLNRKQQAPAARAEPVV